MPRVPVEIIREGNDGGSRTGHNLARILPLLRLPLQIGHRAGMAIREPAIELRGVRIALEPRDAGRGKAELGRALLEGDHRPIVSRRQRAKFTTSRTGGTVFASPYAVNMRHCM